MTYHIDVISVIVNKNLKIAVLTVGWPENKGNCSRLFYFCTDVVDGNISQDQFKVVVVS